MKTVCIVVALISLALLSVSLVLAWRSASLLIWGVRTEGKVLRMEKIPGSARSPSLYAPRIGYRTRQGRSVESRGLAQQYPTFGPGDRVLLHYRPDTPEEMRLSSFDALWGGALAAAIMAYLMAGTVAVMWGSERGVSAPALVGCVFLLLGTPLLLGGAVNAITHARLLNEGQRAQGVVTNAQGRPWKLFKSSRESMNLPAVIRFRASDGREIEFTAPQLNAAYMAPQAHVDLTYRPERPHGAEVLGFKSFWLTAAILGGAGLTLFLIGLRVIRL